MSHLKTFLNYAGFPPLLIWIIVGIMMRFARLSALPPWTDEFATMVFSVGNGFENVPLDEIINPLTLLAPMVISPETTLGDTIHHLFAESTHPPVYFLLAHGWLKGWATDEGLASITAARSLSALFGVALIPAMYGLGWVMFRSRLAAQACAGIMAISPFAVFISREARHYTFVLLLAIASLTCLFVTVRKLNHQSSLNWLVAATWIAINSLGIATHYFFSLLLAAEGIIVLGLAGRDRAGLGKGYWWRIYLVALGTLAGCLVWLPVLGEIYNSAPTQWIQDGDPLGDWISPLLRLLLWGMSMMVLLPSSVTTHLPLAVVIVSGVMTFAFLGWSIPVLIRCLRTEMENQDDTPLIVFSLLGYIGAAIVIVLGFTYGLRMDLTLAARFQFFYYPPVLALLGASLAAGWKGHPPRSRPQNRLAPLTVVSVLGLAMVSGVTVVWDLGYLQNHRPDLLVSVIREASQAPPLIATTHKHHGQTGRMMGVAWEFQRLEKAGEPITAPQFFLAHREPDVRTYAPAIAQLLEQMNDFPRPFDLWLVDFHASVDLTSEGCQRDRQYQGVIGEYDYELYRCQGKGNE